MSSPSGPPTSLVPIGTSSSAASSSHAGGNFAPLEVFPDNQAVVDDPMLQTSTVQYEKKIVTTTTPTPYGPAKPHRTVFLNQEVAQLELALQDQKIQAEADALVAHQTHSAQAQLMLAQQRVGFEHAAQQYEDQGRAVAAREVAIATAEVERLATSRLALYQQQAQEVAQQAVLEVRSAEGILGREKGLTRQLEDRASAIAMANSELESQLNNERIAFQARLAAQESHQVSVFAQLERTINEGSIERQRLSAAFQEQVALEECARVERVQERTRDQQRNSQLEIQLQEMQKMIEKLHSGPHHSSLHAHVPVPAQVAPSVPIERGETSSRNVSLIDTLVRNVQAEVPEEVPTAGGNPTHFRINSPEEQYGMRDAFFDDETPSFSPSSPIQLGETRSANKVEIAGKEADHIKLEGLPNISRFKGWLLSFRKDVASAAGKPEAGFKWISAVETAASYESLADSGEFGVLDCKLAAAFGKILNGEIGRQVNLAEEKAAKNGHMLKGRQIAYMVMDYFKITAQEGAILELDDLVSLQLHSSNLKKFTHDWESTLIGFKSAPSDDMLEALFKREIRKADQLKTY
jgi:hypothetical protein